MRNALNGKRRLAGVAVLGALAVAAVLVTFGGGQATAAARPVIGIAAGGTLQFESAAKQESYLAAAHDLGATWLRFDFTWNDIQRSGPGASDWARYDSLVALAQKHGLNVLGMIAYAPSWARDSSCAGSQFCKPRSAAEYGTFAGQVAQRYAAKGVHHWEIWNEPNLPQFFAPAADPAAYTALLKSAYANIHKADPSASVLSGGAAPAGTGGGSYSPVDFLSGIYAAGGQGSFDVLGHHPYCYAGAFDCPDKQADWSAWTQMSGTKVSLRSLMDAHGDGGKQIWGTEFGAPTNGGSAAVPEAQQADMLGDAVTKFGSTTWAGPLFLYSLQDRGTNPGDREDWFGVLRADGSRKPAFTRVESVLAATGGGANAPAVPTQPTAPAASAAPAAPVVAPTLLPAVSDTAPAAAAPVAAPPAPAAPAQPKKSWWHRMWHSIFG